VLKLTPALHSLFTSYFTPHSNGQTFFLVCVSHLSVVALNLTAQLPAPSPGWATNFNGQNLSPWSGGVLLIVLITDLMSLRKQRHPRPPPPVTPSMMAEGCSGEEAERCNPPRSGLKCYTSPLQLGCICNARNCSLPQNIKWIMSRLISPRVESFLRCRYVKKGTDENTD